MLYSAEQRYAFLFDISAPRRQQLNVTAGGVDPLSPNLPLRVDVSGCCMMLFLLKSKSDVIFRNKCVAQDWRRQRTGSFRPGNTRSSLKLGVELCIPQVSTTY